MLYIESLTSTKLNHNMDIEGETTYRETTYSQRS